MMVELLIRLGELNSFLSKIDIWYRRPATKPPTKTTAKREKRAMITSFEMELAYLEEAFRDRLPSHV